MALSIASWQDEARKIDSHKRADLIKAINTLNSWEPFVEHYGFVGLEVLKTILKIENENTEAELTKERG